MSPVEIHDILSIWNKASKLIRRLDLKIIVREEDNHELLILNLQEDSCHLLNIPSNRAAIQQIYAHLKKVKTSRIQLIELYFKEIVLLWSILNINTTYQENFVDQCKKHDLGLQTIRTLSNQVQSLLMLHQKQLLILRINQLSELEALAESQHDSTLQDAIKELSFPPTSKTLKLSALALKDKNVYVLSLKIFKLQMLVELYDQVIEDAKALIHEWQKSNTIGIN